MALRTKRVAPHSKICERFKSLMAVPAATYTFCQAKHLRCWIQFMWLMFYEKPNIFRIIYVIDKGFVPKIFSLLILERENITNFNII